MARYIDAEKIKFDLSGLAYIYPSDFRKTGAYFIRQIRKIPTADVRENVRGEWEVIAEAYDITDVKTWTDKMRCNRCGFTTYAIERGIYQIYQYNFCPNCGADMRSNENGNTQSV